TVCSTSSRCRFAAPRCRPAAAADPSRRSVSEFELIRRFFTRPGPAGTLGVGDDCALLPSSPGAWAISTDMLLENRHFFSDVAPDALGHKALAVNLSDLAAMGAAPRGF